MRVKSLRQPRQPGYRVNLLSSGFQSPFIEGSVIQRDNQSWTAVDRPQLEWLHNTPRSTTADDIYFSPEDGLAESRHVFLEGVNLRQRLTAMRPGETLTVAETGFGTGLNGLLTLSCYLQCRQPGTRLHYIGLEAYPLQVADLRRALMAFPTLEPTAQWLLDNWPPGVRGCHRRSMATEGFTLDLWWEDAKAALADLASHQQRWVDVWYLDGFAPARDPELWQPDLLQMVACLSKPHATIATFTAAGAVRRALSEHGFTMSKRPGYGRKRECLQGCYIGPVTASKTSVLTPWDRPEKSPKPAHALVVGAGLAGACAARSLAERGISVTVLEAGAVASGGSSNLQGLTYARLSRKHSALNDFSLLGYTYSIQLYQQLLSRGALRGDDGEHCGFIQLGGDATTLDYLTGALAHEADLARVLSTATLAARLPAAAEGRALEFPGALWLHPPAVCRERLDHPLITVYTHTGPVRLESVGSGTDRCWQARAPNLKPTTLWADTAVLATAAAMAQHNDLDWLPLQQIRGQTSHMPATAASRKLGTAICHEGYFPPPRQNVHCMGASYGPNDTSLDERQQDHEHNMTALKRALPGLRLSAQNGEITGHVALRCTSADYLPIVGSAPDRAAFNACYRALGQRKTHLIDQHQPCYTGLWLMGALGSRGLSSAPLLAEQLASAVCNEPPPLGRSLQRALSPARFLLRGLVRGTPL